MIEWLWPWVLLLAPLPFLVQRVLPAAQSQQSALRAPFFNEWQQISDAQGARAKRGNRLSSAALWLLWLLLLIAAARPTWIGEPVELPNSGRDLMMAVDISGSMQLDDMLVGQSRVSRVEAVRQLGAQFIGARTGDRLGLILFGTNAYVQSPLSFDTATVKRFLTEAQIGFAGKETAIGDAIGLAIKRLKERPAQSRVLILLTDGQDDASSVKPRDAAQLAAKLGIRIYTIGIGADSYTLSGLLGTSIGARQVNPSAELDEAGLKQIAKITGGQYFRARDPQDLANIYNTLDKLEPVEQEKTVYRPRQALGYIPLLGAILLSFLLALQHCHFRGRFRPTASAMTSAPGFQEQR